MPSCLFNPDGTLIDLKALGKSKQEFVNELIALHAGMGYPNAYFEDLVFHWRTRLSKYLAPSEQVRLRECCNIATARDPLSGSWPGTTSGLADST